MNKPKLGNLFDIKTSLQLNVFLSLAILSIALALSVSSAHAVNVCVGTTANFTCDDAGAAINQSCTLNGSINTTQNCFGVRANDTVIDGNGYTVTCTTSGKYGVWMEASNGNRNITLKNITIIGCYNSVYFRSGDGNYTIDHVTVNSPENYGIYTSSFNTTITNNNVYGGPKGIYAAGDSGLVTNNIVNGSSTACLGVAGDYNVLNNNNVSYCGAEGIQVLSASNNISNTYLINDSASAGDIYVTGSGSKFINQTFIGSSSVTVSFTGSGMYRLDLPTVLPSDPAGHTNLSRYVNVTNLSTGATSVLLNVSYTDSDFGTLNESALTMWRYNGSSWNSVAGSGVNAAQNYVYATITNFSIFAPMGQLPLSCGDAINTSTTLSAELTGCAGNGLVINASNVVLDCNGHSISGTGSSTAVNVTGGANNVTVINCTINNFTEGVYLDGGNNHSILHNNINFVTYPIDMNGVMKDGINISYNNIYAGGGVNGLIRIVYVNNTVVSHNNISDATDYYSMLVFYSGTVNVDSNTINNSKYYGLKLQNAVGYAVGNITVQNNIISYGQNETYGWGIDIYDGGSSSAYTIKNNTVSNNNAGGISISGSTGPTNKIIYHNNIYNNGLPQINSNGAIYLDNGSSGNYWGNPSCPVFTAGTDSNAVNVIDMYAYNATDGWLTGAPADCIACGDAINSSTILTGDLTSCTGDGLIINASNVVLDCAGNKIAGDYLGGGDGISINESLRNITVKNCTIYGFNGSNMASIRIGGGDNDTTIVNNVLYDNYHGIVKVDAPYGYGYNISDNLIQNTTIGYGIIADYITGFNAYNNRIYNTGYGYGIYTLWTNGTISGNVINNSYYSALMLNYFSGLIINNTLTYSRYVNDGAGIVLASYYAVNITNNTIANNKDFGLFFMSKYPDPYTLSNKLVYHNNIYNNSPSQVFTPDTIELSNGSEGNYWGRIDCPTFIPGTDSNTGSATDSYAYNASNGWLDREPAKCAPILNSFVNGASATYEIIGIEGSMDAPHNISLYVTITNTSAAWVNITGGGNGLCLGLSDNQMMEYVGGGVYTINCSVNKTVLQGLGSPYNLTAVAYNFMTPTVTNTADFTLYSNFVHPTVVDAGVLNPDIFFSSVDKVVYVYANVTDDNAVTVTADFTNITSGATCTNVSMPFNATSGLYEGSCNIGTYITNTNFTGKQILVTATDNYTNWNITGFGIVTHNYGVPAFSKGPCLTLGPGSTNLTEELDFNHIELTFKVNVNVSCYMNNDSSLPKEWRDGATIIIHDVNLTNQSVVQKLSNLSNNIDVVITGPNSYGDSRIAINSNYFKELNKSSSITIHGIPFTEQPNILVDSGAAGLNGSATWVTNGYQSDLGVVTGNLSFDVKGFSGYNATENAPPTVKINAPLNGSTITTNTTNVSFIVNGTGTQLSSIVARIGSDTLFSYNNTVIHTNCTNLTVGWDVVECNKTVTVSPDSAKTLTVTVKDFGGKAGNNATNTSNFTVDTTAPIMSNISISNITNESAKASWNTNENALCKLSYWNNLSNIVDPPSYNTTHTKTLAPLEEGTVYYYNITCTDQFGNPRTTGIDSFTTSIYEKPTITNNTPTTVTFNVTDNGTNTTALEMNIVTNESVNATISITEQKNNPAGTNLSVPGLNTYYSIDSGDLNSSNIKWIYIKIYYNDSDISPGVREASLRLYRFNATLNKWIIVTPSGVNTTANYIWANITHFSYYAMAEEPSQEESGAQGGGLGSGLSPAGQNLTLDLSQSASRTMAVGDSVSFRLGSESHSAKIFSLTFNSVVLQISSTPLMVTVNVGETKLIDVNGDGTNDLSIFLEKVYMGKAYLTFAGTEAPTQPTTQPPTTQPPAEQPGAQQPPATQPPVTQPTLTDNTAIIIVIALIVSAVIVVWMYKNKKK